MSVLRLLGALIITVCTGLIGNWIADMLHLAVRNPQNFLGAGPGLVFTSIGIAAGLWISRSIGWLK